MQNYFLYHLHSDLSNCTITADSVTKYKDYIQRAQECGMTALAFTEHGNIFEWYFKKLDVEKAGMKYVHGVEAYVTEDNADSIVYSGYPVGTKKPSDYTSIWTQDGKTYGRKKVKKNEVSEVEEIDPEKITTRPRTINDNYHVILLAKNYEGFKEINRLTSESYNREDGHYYYKPRIRFEDLIQTSDNVVITTACLGGIIYQKSPLEDSTIKERFINFLIEHKDRCYLELQHHQSDEQKEYNKLLVKLHESTGIPLIVGTDTHALNQEQMEARKYLQTAKKNEKEDKEIVSGGYYEDDEKLDLTFKTAEELIDAYKLQNAIEMKYVFEAMQNSLELAESIEEFSINADAKYPKLFDNSEELFKEKILEGAEKLGFTKSPDWPAYKERIDTETEIYKHNNAIDFMLLEWDYKNAVAEKGVLPGPSRGSVSGSIIADCLNVTYVDSVKYGLNFERFMHNERVSLADVDSDWFDLDREVVKDYLYQREKLYCSEIATFNQVKRKSAIDSICKAMYFDLPNKKYLAIAERLKAILCVENDGKITDDEFKRFQRRHPELYKSYGKCLRLVNDVIGTIVSIGNHPAATIVSPHDLEQSIGTFTTSKCKYPISSLYMKEVDALNYVKLDILGLDTVGLIRKTCELAGIEPLTARNTDFEDEKVWKEMANDSTMIFQFEGDMGRAYLKDLLSDSTVKKVKKNDDNFSYLNLCAMASAALRPAGASYRDELKKGKVKKYGCKPLDDFMAPSLGYMIYQETIMNFLNRFCGFTMGKADMVRRGFAKKTGTEQWIPQIKEGFIETMTTTYGESKESAEKIIVDFIKVIEDASDYAFSENHAIPYTMISYMAGWLRYYYKLEFVTTALNIFSSKEEKLVNVTDYAKRNGFMIHPIKFRYSKSGYTCDRQRSETDIYQGISSVKGLNSKAADQLYSLKNNHYDTFMDVLLDIKRKNLKEIKRNMIKTLIELDFFSEFGDPGYLLAQYQLFDTFGGRKTISKTWRDFGGVEPLTLLPAIMMSTIKETDKQITFDSEIFLKNAANLIEWKPQSMTERVKAEFESLGYVDYVNDKCVGYAFVIDEKIMKRPAFKVYSIKNGTTMACRVKPDVYKNSPFGKGDILKIYGTDRIPKYVMDENGEWVKDYDNKELHLTRYLKVGEIKEV